MDIRREILKAFADLGGSEAIEGLLDGLHSYNADLRLESARRLARIRPERAKSGLLRFLSGYDWDVIRVILEAFEPPYGLPEDIPTLMSVAQRAPTGTIKYLATRAINSIIGDISN